MDLGLYYDEDFLKFNFLLVLKLFRFLKFVEVVERIVFIWVLLDLQLVNPPIEGVFLVEVRFEIDVE